MNISRRGTLKVVDNQPGNYHLQEQVGFILRKAHQRHVSLFARTISELTPPQFAALSKLSEVGETSQNQLGSLIAMDAATVKGVIGRLKARGLVQLARHEGDKRRIMVSLTDEGRAMVDRMVPLAEEITAETLKPLSPKEAATLLRLLTLIT